MKLGLGKSKSFPEVIDVEQKSNADDSSTSGNVPGNNGGGNDSSGDDRKKGNPFADDQEFLPNKSRIAMWFLLLIVGMTFAGLIAAYMVIATNVNKGIEWQPFKLPIQVWISSIVIIASTITFEIHNRILAKNQQSQARKWLLITAALGGIFIASQLLSWLELVNRGIYMSGNPYAGFFYIMTGVHALHVIGGISAIGYMILKTQKPTDSSDELFKRQTLSGVFGWYWHTMDGLWLILFLLLGFWK
jgi:cytochrome c oxidase subunit III